MRLGFVVVFLVIAGFAIVGPISFSHDSGAAPVLPNTQQQFSLDLKVVGSMQHDVVYVVEQRARPAYRIFAFDPATGVVTTVFTVPKDAIIYGIALSPDRKRLAVSYSPDFHINGSGLSLLDLDSKVLTQITSATTGVFDVDLEWSNDATSIYSTHVDQRTSIEKLDIAQTSIANRSTKILIRNGVNPTVSASNLYYLEVDSKRARHTIRQHNADSVISVGDGTLDLDHLVKGVNRATLRVGVLHPEPARSVTLGTPAKAHGNHEVASLWWNVSTTGSPDAVPTSLNPTVVYDASSRGNSIVYANQAGLAIATGSTQTNLIASRAIRLVAA